jgi:regulator of replication initiation timing
MLELMAVVNASIETAKKLKALNEKIENADVKMLIADLCIQLSEAKLSISELLDNNRKLQEEINSLRSDQCEPLIFKDGVYYDSNNDGPFCPSCYDEKKRKHRMVPINPMYHKPGVHKCVVCDKRFNTNGSNSL